MMKDEICPKCCSQDVGVWGFNGDTVDYECNLCRHKWIAPRESFGEKVKLAYHEAASYKECKGKKHDASSLEEFCQEFKKNNDKKVEVWPYVPRIALEGDSDFGLIVESGHVKYEVGLSRVLFFDENGFLRRWVQQPRLVIFDFSPIKEKMRMFENFATGLSRFLTEKGCNAFAGKIQYLGRAPERTLGDEDLKIFVQILTEYC